MIFRPLIRLTFLIAITSALVIPVAALADPEIESDESPTVYQDIGGHWAENVMRQAQIQYIIEGDGQNLMPDAPISAAQIAAILFRSLGAEQVQAELPGDKWYSQAIDIARVMGYLPEGIADYEKPLPRVAVFQMVLDAFSLETAMPDVFLLTKYKDVAEYNSDTRITMANAVAYGLAVGDGGALRAHDTITRAEFITILFRVAGKFGDFDRRVNAVIHGDAEISGYTTGNRLWFGITSSRIELENVSAKGVTIRSPQLEELTIDRETRLGELVIASRGSDVELELGEDAIGKIVIGYGDGEVRLKGSLAELQVTGSERVISLDGEFDRVVVGGFGNTIHMAYGTQVNELVVAGDSCVFEIGGTVSALTLHGTDARFAGNGSVEYAVVTDYKFDLEELPRGFVEATDARDPGLNGVSAPLIAPLSLPAGEILRVTAQLSSARESACYGIWYVDGRRVGASVCEAGDISLAMEYEYEYSRGMADRSEITLAIYYFMPSGQTVTYTERTSVRLENFGDDYYYQFDRDRILELVTSPYRGDYTLEYALENDYADFEKTIWVNAKGYSSDTQYLVWVNLAYQRVNIFEGSAGEWELVRSGIVGTGAPGTGTPTGVWKTTYKQEYGWTTGSYTVVPVVRFRGGGYAFHSRLYYPNTWTLNDPSIGFPVSHGCVRMYQEDIQWMFDNVPDGSTVVVF